jgi:hypothetical protein
MNSPSPVPTNDPTLTATPHIVAVIIGVAAGWLTSKGVPAEYVTWGAIGATTVGTSLVHWIMAKLSA